MKKDTYYFPHDHHARKDPKCLALVKDFGMTGYGFYWCFIEMLYEQGGKVKKFPALYSGIAHEFGIKTAVVEKIILAMLNQYDLLIEDDTHIWSEAVLRRLEHREEKKHKKIEAGRRGGISSGLSRTSKQNEALLQDASPLPKQNEANEAKEIKLNKTKGKDNTWNTKPQFDDVGDLPQTNINAVIEKLSISKNVTLNPGEVQRLFRVFKTDSLTGTKYYSDLGAVYSHFSNWANTQKFDKRSKEELQTTPTRLRKIS